MGTLMASLQRPCLSPVFIILGEVTCTQIWHAWTRHNRQAVKRVIWSRPGQTMGRNVCRWSPSLPSRGRFITEAVLENIRHSYCTPTSPTSLLFCLNGCGRIMLIVNVLLEHDLNTISTLWKRIWLNERIHELDFAPTAESTDWLLSFLVA